MHTLPIGTEQRLRSALVRLRSASLWLDAISRLVPKMNGLDAELPLLSRCAFLKECAQIHREKGGCCVVLHFPQADDHTLHVASIVLFETLRRTDVFGRLNTQALAVALPGCSMANAHKVKDRIEEALRAEAARNPQAGSLIRNFRAEVVPLSSVA